MASEWEAQLMALRALTATTGVVHEAQRLQIKSWGAVAFGAGPGLWDCDVDVSTRTVEYRLTKRPRHVATWRAAAPYVAALDRSVHWLFGPEWQLVVRHADNLLYEGARTAPDTHERRKSRVEG